MFSLKTLLITLFLISFTSSPATSSEIKSVSIQLQQTLNTHCNGVIDTPYSSKQLVSALPNQCVMYKIIVKNITTKNLSEIAIKGNIPPYTTLKKQSVFVYKEGRLHTDIVFQYLDSAQINVKLTKLASFQTITIFYSVHVN
ncbi:MAG: hypothetical protein KAG20_09710 [Cocleimonas sp.]|nr:hypothetical protein [Cocleimonas sp.]